MARSKRAHKVRTREEFDLAALLQRMLPPRSSAAAYAWDAAKIAQAKDAQIRGALALPTQLVRAMLADDAIYSAWQVRMSPEAALGIAIDPAPGARGASIGAEGEALFGAKGAGLTAGTRQAILADLVSLGVAFARAETTAREDGSRVDLRVRHWPAEHCYRNEDRRTWVTRLDDGTERDIENGVDGWIIFQKSDHESWIMHAAVTPASLVWRAHAFGIRDWETASYSQANAKVAGTLPESWAYSDSDGALTSQALGFLEVLKAAAATDAMAAIIPAGATIEYLANPSTMHEIWKAIVENRERAAQRIYCGTDASLGSPGGAPGVDILTLFGVSNTIGEGDLRALALGWQMAIDTWAAINFGDSSLAPAYKYLIPNADEQAQREAYATRLDAALDAIAKMRASGLALAQEDIDTIASRFDVDLPTLSADTSSSTYRR